MNNKMKKRTITGVAIISGAILFSVGVAGTVHLINENNAIEAKTYVTAKENNFNTSPTPVIKEVNGITYSLNTTDNTATVTAINKPESGSKVIGSAGTSNSVFDTLYVNIPQSITVDYITYTIRYVGNNSNIFSSSFESYCGSQNTKNVIVILPKTVSTVAGNTFGVPSYLSTVYLINVSNNISIPNQNDGKLKVFGVPGSGSEEASPNFFINLYSYGKNESTRLATLKGFSPNAKQLLEYLPSGVTVNFEMPTFISENNEKYTVTTIENRAFEDCTFIKTLIIPGTVNKIEASAFQNCTNINWVKFLSKKISIDGQAFISDHIEEIYALTGSGAKTFWDNNKNYGNIGIQNSTFKALTVQSIDSVVQMPYRTSYNLGDTLDSRGIVLKLTMNNNPNGTLNCYVTPDSADLTFSPTTLSTAGTQTINVSYEGKSATFDVSVTDPTPAPGPSTEEYEVNLYDSDTTTVLSTLTLKDGYFYQDGNKIEKNGKFKLPTKDGYTFVSYNGAGNSASKWILSDGTFGSEAQYDAVYNTLVEYKKTNPSWAYMSAEWSENEKTMYTIKFDTKGGTGGPSSSIQRTEGYPATIPPDIPTKDGYLFDYWCANENGFGQMYRPGDYIWENSCTLYAQWISKTHTVHYDANKGTGAPIDDQKIYGEDLVISSSQPTREGYKFIGWNTCVDGSGNTYQPGVKYSDDVDLTLYAQWEPITHTVHYDANGGEWRR